MNPSIAVAVSGGRDSMALLHALSHAAAPRGVQVVALHVHHGLMPQADEWAAFVERTCRRWAKQGWPVAFAGDRLQGPVPPGESIEAWARAGRYAALAELARDAGCTTVALAHHRGDQAETFLLQALRGAGPAGLASMPAARLRDGITWLRPWLDQSREAIDAYVRLHRITHVEDQSNADPRIARSRLRLQVMPALRAAFPDAEHALADAARRAARAHALIDEVARADAAAACDGDALVIDRWQALSPARQREALRAWLQPVLCGVPETLLDRLERELPAGGPARWPLDGQRELRRWRGRATVATARHVAPATWPCDAMLLPAGVHPVPGTESALCVIGADARGQGSVPLALLHGAQWRARQGSDRFQRAPSTPPRSLKKQFQDAGVSAWSRDAPLLVSASGALIFAPGLGTDARALAVPGAPRVRLEWIARR
jgi:tRNA(Ile)-lysidine synthase